jgi:ribA/ribD-fused uncharacterized protein
MALKKQKRDKVINIPRGVSYIDFHGPHSSSVFYFLSVFHPSKFYLDDEWWDSVAQWYYTRRCDEPGDWAYIKAATTPAEAKAISKGCKSIDDWDNNKWQLMYDGCYAKFDQNPELKSRLISTGDKELREMSPFSNYWGYSNRGQNQLGKILMDIREKVTP